jgi:tetratricopeptide (TPR) repeat protein
MSGPRNEFTGTNTGRLVQAGRIDQVNIHPPASAPTALTGLPADDELTGRTDELTVLATVLAPDPAPDTPAVCTIAGLGGVGKTALAVRAARLAEDSFAGGVLFIDLHGYDEARRVSATAALSTFVSALGVDPNQIRAEQAALELLYRSVLSMLARQGRRVLVLVDNAASPDQVLPLRPGDPAHRMLVTSRHNLPITGARRLELDLLSEADALVLLDHAVRAANADDTRIAIEPDRAVALVRLCGRLPLALRIIAHVLADRPDQPLAELVAILAAEQGRLGELAYGDSVAVRGVFDTSYQRLPAEQARLFRLLAINRGPFVDLDTAASIADLPASTTRRLLDGLRQAHLIQPTPYGHGMHDLVKLYAAERCAQDEPQSTRTATIRRLLAHYLAGVQSAQAQLDTPNNSDQAVAWLNRQQINIVAAVELGGDAGADEAVKDIALALGPSWEIDWELDWSRDSWVTVHELAAAAARRLSDRNAEARILSSLGDIYGDSATKMRCYEQALALYRELDDSTNRARTQFSLASNHLALNQYNESLDHFTEAATDFQAAGHLDNAARAYHYIGALYTTLGDDKRAEESVQRALELYREAGDLAGEASIWNAIGRDRAENNLCTEAIAAHQRALAIWRGLGNKSGEAVELTHLGDNYRQSDQPAEALTNYYQALALHRESASSEDDEELLEHIRDDEATVLSSIGATQADLGEWDKALESYRQSVVVFQQDGDIWGKGAEVQELITRLEQKRHDADYRPRRAWYPWRRRR